jgi:hypothetical protein
MSLINTIKGLFEAAAVETAKVKCTDVKTSDGIILRVEGDLVEGAIASVIAEDGSVNLAPAQDYTLEDGTVVTIGDQGAIAKIVAPEAMETTATETPMAETPAVDAPVAEETPAEEGVETDKLVELEAKVAELEAAVAKCVEMINSMGAPAEQAMKEVKAENRELKKQVKELASAPASPESNFKKVEYTAIDALKKNNAKTNKTNETLMSKIIALKG